MKLQNILLTLMMWITLAYSIPISRNCNRFTDFDCDHTNNRLKSPTLKGGGGWPSGTGNPSGGGRWNSMVNYDNDNHANQMNPNNDEYYHSRGL